ncbi:MAG: hypothetical protein HW405_620, partial [Candidatus Berkelbacteria bacterium]|nr:hypothetical protein [Candidatus Berkelbacteria bacterium]
EEIVFRAPLMLLFPSLTKTVWVAVIISSLVFGALHATKNWINRGNLSGMPGVVESSQGIGWRIWRFSITTILGFILAYQAVLHQSLYRCFWIHLCWNVFFMLIFPLLLRFLIPLVCNAWMAITGRNFQRSRYF